MSLVIAFVLSQRLTFVSSATPVRITANNTAPTVAEDNQQQQCDLFASSDYELVLCPADPRLYYTPLKKEWPFQFRYPRMPILSSGARPAVPLLLLDAHKPLTLPLDTGYPMSSDQPVTLPDNLLILMATLFLGLLIGWIMGGWIERRKKGSGLTESYKPYTPAPGATTLPLDGTTSANAIANLELESLASTLR